MTGWSAPLPIEDMQPGTTCIMAAKSSPPVDGGVSPTKAASPTSATAARVATAACSGAFTTAMPRRL